MKIKRKRTILMLSWRDIKNPLMGGAEIFTHEVLKRLTADGYYVIHFSPMFSGAKGYEIIDGIHYLRKGNVFSVIVHSMIFYKRYKNRIDIVIDQCNTHRFFTPFWVEKEKRVFLIFQLCRELWSIMLPGVFGYIGKILETPMLKLYRNVLTLTESDSVRNELLKIGFRKENTHIVPIGLDFEPWKEEEFEVKEENPTFIYVGRYAKYKGINDLVVAFGMLKKDYPKAKLWLLGKKDENYINNVLRPLWEKSGLKEGSSGECDICLWGFVEDHKKKELQSKAHALVFPSLREGWGMIVTEAAAVGTPSIVYNSTGGIDAVDCGKAGYLCKENTPDGLYLNMKRVIENDIEYAHFRRKAYEFSKQFSWDKSACIMKKVTERYFE